MTQQLFIPDKIKVGFQSRNDTYTKKLAYVIYFDQKGVLRKEKSWETWRDKKIEPTEFVNEPMEGFVLNKGVGGNRHSYGWNARNEYIRVYDPRDFEFEISVSNLLFILRECDCSKGKGLEGKFAYAWDGTELVLLPAISEDYKNSEKFTKLQDQRVLSKELIPGASYTTKKQKVLTFVGRFNYYFMHSADSYRHNKKDESGVCKKYVFWNGNDFEYTNDLKTIATLNSDQIAPNYAELVEKYATSVVGSQAVEFIIKAEPAAKKKDSYYSYDYFYVPTDAGYQQCYAAENASYRKYNYTTNTQEPNDKIFVQATNRFFFKDGVLNTERYGKQAYPYGEEPKIASNFYNRDYERQQRANIIPWIEPTLDRLYVRLESGQIYKITDLKQNSN